MTVQELMDFLAKQDPSALVVISAHDGGQSVAGVDLIKPCTVQPPVAADQFAGNYHVAHEGTKALWLGWSKGFETDYTVAFIENTKDEWPWI